MKEVIRQDQWLAELERLGKKNDAGMTSHEWAASLKINVKLAAQKIRQAMDLGWVTLGRRSSVRIDGIAITVPVYLIRRPSGMLTTSAAVKYRARKKGG